MLSLSACKEYVICKDYILVYTHEGDSIFYETGGKRELFRKNGCHVLCWNNATQEYLYHSNDGVVMVSDGTALFTAQTTSMNHYARRDNYIFCVNSTLGVLYHKGESGWVEEHTCSNLLHASFSLDDSPFLVVTTKGKVTVFSLSPLQVICSESNHGTKYTKAFYDGKDLYLISERTITVGRKQISFPSYISRLYLSQQKIMVCTMYGLGYLDPQTHGYYEYFDGDFRNFDGQYVYDSSMNPSLPPVSRNVSSRAVATLSISLHGLLPEHLVMRVISD